MNQFILYTFISISIICGLSGCRVQAQYITEAQAIQAVRNFEGNQSLNFDLIEFKQDSTINYGFDGSNYWLSKSNPARDWHVNASSGQVSGVSYTDRWPDQYQSEPYGSYSQSQCCDIALTYARAKYNGFDGMGFQLKTSEWDENGWKFYWIQKIAYDAETLNDVTVSVNPCTGQIMYYRGCKVTVTIPNAPTVTSQQAINIAKQHAGIVQNLEVCTSPWLLAYPDGTLVWTMEIGGSNAQGYDIGYGININAVTGAVTEAEQASYLGSTKQEQDKKGSAKAQENAKKAADALKKCTSICITNKMSHGKQQEIRQESKNFAGTIKAVQGLLRNGTGITDKSPGSKAAKYNIRFHTADSGELRQRFRGYPATDSGDKAPPVLQPICPLLDASILVRLALLRQWILPLSHGFAFHFQPV